MFKLLYYPYAFYVYAAMGEIKFAATILTSQSRWIADRVTRCAYLMPPAVVWQMLLPVRDKN